jgi:DNA-binding transcriptional LysR family regulator
LEENAQYLLAIAEHGSISEAAQACHLSQPALSKRLGKLESSFGVELFDRAKKPLRPTYAGSIYLEWARNAVLSETRMAKQIGDAAMSVSRHLRIGVSASRYARLLADTVERFYREVEGCTLEFTDCACDDRVNKLLADRKIDFAVLIPQQPESTLFEVKPMREERLTYIAPSSWDLKTINQGGLFPIVSVAEIAKHPFIMPEPTIHLSSTIQTIFDSQGVKPFVIMTCAGIDMRLEMARRGLGAYVSTSTSMRSSDSRLLHCEIEGYPGIHSLNYVRWRNRPASEDERLFIHLLNDWLDELPA